jgi:hypothetical protein
MKAIDFNRKKYIGKLLLSMVVALVICLSARGAAQIYAAAADGTGISDIKLTGAPSGTVSELRQTGASTSSVDIQFSALSGSNVQYAVMIGTSENAITTEYTTVSGGFASVSGLAPGSTYYVQVIPFCEETAIAEPDDADSGNGMPVAAGTSRIYGTSSAVLSVVTTPSAAPQTITQSGSSANSVTITWTAVSGASGYLVDYFLTESAAPEKIRLVTSETRAELTGLSSSKSYTAVVTPYRYSREGFTASDSSICASKSNLTVGALTAGKPSGVVSGFTQKKASADSAEISFQLPDKSAQYSVQLGRSKKDGFSEYAVVKEGSCTFTELEAASSYYVRVVPFYQNWNSLNEEYDRVYGTASEVFEIVTAPSKSPKSITQTAATKTGFTITWDSVDGANGYCVDYYPSGSTKQSTKKVSKNQVKLTKLTANKEYNVYVTPYRKSASGFIAVDETLYTSRFNIPVKPSKAGKAKVTKFWQSLGKVNLKTKKIECADGYQYALYTAYGDTSAKITTVTSTSYSSADIKNVKLKTSGVFKVRVRAYITIEGKKVYGAWSDWNYISAPVQVSLKRSGSTISAGWTKVKGADRYAVYISTDRDSGYKKCFVTTKTSCAISSYGKASIKSGTKYYVYVVPQVKVDGVYRSVAGKDAVAEVK